MTSLPVASHRFLWERGGAESFASLLFRLLVALGPLLQQPVLFPSWGGGGFRVSGSPLPGVCCDEGDLTREWLGVLGGRWGGSTARRAQRDSGIPIVQWSLPTKHLTLNVERTAVKHQFELFPELSTVQI